MLLTCVFGCEQSLSSEAHVHEALLKELVDTGDSFVSYLTDADQVQMMQQLEHTKEHLTRWELVSCRCLVSVIALMSLRLCHCMSCLCHHADVVL